MPVLQQNSQEEQTTCWGSCFGLASDPALSSPDLHKPFLLHSGSNKIENGLMLSHQANGPRKHEKDFLTLPPIHRKRTEAVGKCVGTSAFQLITDQLRTRRRVFKTSPVKQLFCELAFSRSTTAQTSIKTITNLIADALS